MHVFAKKCTKLHLFSKNFLEVISQTPITGMGQVPSPQCASTPPSQFIRASAAAELFSLLTFLVTTFNSKSRNVLRAARNCLNQYMHSTVHLSCAKWTAEESFIIIRASSKSLFSCHYEVTSSLSVRKHTHIWSLLMMRSEFPSGCHLTSWAVNVATTTKMANTDK